MTSQETIFSLLKGVDIVYHVGGLVGPFYAKELYYKVNVEGTKTIIEGCK
jgi:nucleoside-diphosphate-sugar epimerase